MWEDLLADAACIEPEATLRDLPRLFLQRRGFRANVGYRLQRAGRDGHRLAGLAGKLISRWVVEFQHIELPVQVDVGPGLRFFHGHSTIVHHHVTLGAGVTLSHQVTLGVVSEGPRAGAPTLEDGVFISPGAIVIGNITVGKGAVVGAGAVVVRDVPPGAVVAGVPAKVVTTALARANRSP